MPCACSHTEVLRSGPDRLVRRAVPEDQSVNVAPAHTDWPPCGTNHCSAGARWRRWPASASGFAQLARVVVVEYALRVVACEGADCCLGQMKDIGQETAKVWRERL